MIGISIMRVSYTMIYPLLKRVKRRFVWYFEKKNQSSEKIKKVKLMREANALKRSLKNELKALEKLEEE
jgi:hypothetical protein